MRTYHTPASPQVLMDRACAEAGLSDFGPYPFREGLEYLVLAARGEALLSAAGLEAFESDVVVKLVNRLRLAADLRAHPEITAERITRPVIITGTSRGGTTTLQRVLSADPGVQRLDRWRALNPAPFPNAKPAERDPRIAWAKHREENFISKQHPQLWAAHQFTAEEPDEDSWMIDITFESAVWWSKYRVPSFMTWFQRRDQSGQFRFLKLLLQYLQWQDGGARGRPWILKNPQNAAYIGQLLQTFPDALLVQIHRSPAEVIASVGSAAYLLRKLYSDDADPREVAYTQFRYKEWLFTEYLRQRTPAAEEQFLDVWYSDFIEDSKGVIRQIYERAGMKLTPAALAAVDKWNADNPQHKHGAHKYSLDNVGLSESEVEAAFAAYNARFGLSLRNT